ncbi:hypothetical protein Deval_0150 [Nitratidesulfovibrio vulgaris RCH1]|nr:hypothetical protein Deval_0150 [Nitratidesulfovibrio vulgaris RCH1]
MGSGSFRLRTRTGTCSLKGTSLVEPFHSLPANTHEKHDIEDVTICD